MAMQFRDAGTGGRCRDGGGRVWQCLAGAAACVGTIEETDEGLRFYGNAMSGEDDVGIGLTDLFDIQAKMAEILTEYCRSADAIFRD